jgi:hypothetical protein
MEAPYADVRPAWAHSWRCKSSRKLVTASEVKRNCMRATECGKEAWSVNREPMDKNRIEGAAEQGEWAKDHEALVTKARWRKCGGCAMKECDPYLGTPRFVAERPTANAGARSQQRS